MLSPESQIYVAGHRGMAGSAIVSRQLAKLKEMGTDVRTASYLENLIQAEDGRVIGIKVRSGYKFPDEKSGTIKYVKARKAVILATGGFSRDVPFRLAQDPKLVAEVDSTNQPGATAEAFKEALRIGATPVQPSWIQLGPWASPDEKGFGLGPHFASGAVFCPVSDCGGAAGCASLPASSVASPQPTRSSLDPGTAA